MMADGDDNADQVFFGNSDLPEDNYDFLELPEELRRDPNDLVSNEIFGSGSNSDGERQHVRAIQIPSFRYPIAIGEATLHCKGVLPSTQTPITRSKLFQLYGGFMQKLKNRPPSKTKANPNKRHYQAIGCFRVSARNTSITIQTRNTFDLRRLAWSMNNTILSAKRKPYLHLFIKRPYYSCFNITKAGKIRVLRAKTTEDAMALLSIAVLKIEEALGYELEITYMAQDTYSATLYTQSIEERILKKIAAQTLGTSFEPEITSGLQWKSLGVPGYCKVTHNGCFSVIGGKNRVTAEMLIAGALNRIKEIRAKMIAMGEIKPTTTDFRFVVGPQ
jgi:hypothetical protein